MKRIKLLSVFFIGVVSITLADNTKKQASGDIRISNPWLRTTPENHSVTAGYLTISNEGKTEKTLIRVSASFSEPIEIHTMMETQNGVMRMKPVQKGVSIQPGDDVEFKPGGLHIMFMKLKQTISPGKKYRIKLHFENGEEHEILMTGKKNQ